MRAETSAGTKAGFIVGLLFMASVLIRLIIVTGPIDVDALFGVVSIGTAYYPAWMLLILGLVFGFALCGIVGAVAGFIFAKFVNRVPVRSTYIKSVAFGVVLVVFFSLVLHFSVARAIVPLAISPVHAVIFAYLFKRWTTIAKSPVT